MALQLTAKLLVGLRADQTRMTTSLGSAHRRQCLMWHPGSSEIATVGMMIHPFRRGSKIVIAMAMVRMVATALLELLRELLLELLLGISNLLLLHRRVGSLPMALAHTPACHRRRLLQALLELLRGISNLLHPHHRVRGRRLR